MRKMAIGNRPFRLQKCRRFLIVSSIAVNLYVVDGIADTYCIVYKSR